MSKPALKELSWEEAIKEVLQSKEVLGSMHYVEIAERIAAKGLKSRIGANPASAVAAVLSRSLANDEHSPFQKVGRGEFMLRGKIVPEAVAPSNDPEQSVEESETGALRAFGMFWRRSEVMWTGKPKLLGKAQMGATDVNFCDQVGVYLLHDRDRVIYVGRANDSLYARLKVHVSDRLGGRWDRFSWFGLRSVGTDGSLSEPSVAWSHTVVIETLEALLIESLEPPLNRKRGDNFSGAEYLQSSDPDIERKAKEELLREMGRGII